MLDKQYLDTNVKEEALERIRNTLDLFDDHVVSFSGGKDSLVLLHLVKTVLAERGIDKVNVAYRDEELVSRYDIEFMEMYAKKSWVNMHWLCYSTQSQVKLLDREEMYVQWDTNREFLRQPPEGAYTFFERSNWSREEKDALLAQHFKGKVAIFVGIRADESMQRLRSVSLKEEGNYFSGKNPKFKQSKPIYDWREDDIFKYLYEEQIPYNISYDAQLYAKKPLRLAGPLHAESARHLDKLRMYDIELYQKCVDLVPAVATYERYRKDYAGNTVELYSFADIRKYILENMPKSKQAFCLGKLRTAKTSHYNFPEAYPIWHISKYFTTGKALSGHQSNVLPLDKGSQARRKAKDEMEK